MSKIAIGIPTMSTVSASFFTSILAQEYSPDHEYQYIIEDGSMVYTARGRIAQKAIADHADLLICFDSDMILPPDTINRLVDAVSGRDFVTGLYFQRRLPTKPLILKSLDWYDSEIGPQEFAETYECYPKNSVFTIAGCGFGCCIIRMDMVKDLAARFKVNPWTPLPRLSEDYSFSFRAKQAGYSLWCDSSIKPLHGGLKLYGEADWIRQNEPIEPKEDA